MSDEEIDALATQCMESDNQIVADFHKLAAGNAKLTERHAIYARYEAHALVNAVSEAHPAIDGAAVLKVAARIAERARVDG